MTSAGQCSTSLLCLPISVGSRATRKFVPEPACSEDSAERPRRRSVYRGEGGTTGTQVSGTDRAVDCPTKIESPSPSTVLGQNPPQGRICFLERHFRGTILILSGKRCSHQQSN